MTDNKLTKTAAGLDKFFKVLQRIVTVCLIVSLIVMAVATVHNAIDPNAVIGTGFNSIDIGSITIELAEEYAPGNDGVLLYSWIILGLMAVFAAAVCWSFGIVRRILQPMAQGHPFDGQIPRCFRKLAYASLVMGAVANIAGWVETSAAIRQFGLSRLAEGGQVVSVIANYRTDLTFLLVFFFLLLMEYVFRYGAALQQLSDETL